MRTTVEYKNGNETATDDVAPSIAIEENEILLCDSSSGVEETIALSDVKRVVFEVD